MIASEKYAQPLAASIRLSPLCIGRIFSASTGGGYGDIGNFEESQFSYRRTCNADIISQGASFFTQTCGLLPSFLRKLVRAFTKTAKTRVISPQKPCKITTDNLSLPDKYKFGAKNSLSVINKMQSKASAGFTATDKAQSEVSDTPTAFNKMQSEVSDTPTAFNKMQSEASDGFTAFNKVLSEVSDGFTATDKAQSEASDTFTATNNILSETSDSLADSHKHESEGQENKSPVKGNKEFL